jgi:hypothetical protein
MLLREIGEREQVVSGVVKHGRDPTAMTTAWDTIRRFMQNLQAVASRNTFGEAKRCQIPFRERGDLLVKTRADSRDLRLRDSRIGAEGLYGIINLPSGDPVQICLHHDRKQGLVNSAATLQQCREEGSPAEASESTRA